MAVDVSIELPACGRQIVNTSAPPTISSRTGCSVTLDEVDKYTSQAARMNEADLGASRAWTADMVDDRDTGLLKRRKRPVDIFGLEGDVVQSGAARSDELGNGALILARRTCLRGFDKG